jgi:glycine oxidase
MPETIIIGGGIIGLLTAKELHAEGMNVLLLEKGPLGGESSWAGGGIISPLYPWQYDDSVNRLAEASKSIYPELYNELLQETGVDSELLDSGLLYAETEGLSCAVDWCEKWSVQYELLASPQQMRKVEPRLSAEFEAGIWLPEIMQIRNPRLVKAMQKLFEVRRIPYRDHTQVNEIIISGNRVSGVRSDDGDIPADRVVIASGAWSAGLVESVHGIDIEPVKGQMIMFKTVPGLVKRMVLSKGRYIIPRKDGRVLAGSTLERSGFDKSITQEALQTLKHDAIRIIPQLAAFGIERQWAGLRPGTKNGIPYICRHPDVENLFINAGHYRNGVALGTASAKLMSQMILGRTPLYDPEPYTICPSH